MTYEEVESRMRKAISNTDTMESEVEKVLSDIKLDYETAAGQAETVKEQTERILDLQDTKQKLYLQLAGQDEKEEEEPPTGDAVITALIDEAISIDEKEEA